MKSLSLLLVLFALLSQVGGGGDPCGTGEEPCDAERPWMRGRIEKSCVRADLLEQMREAQPGRIILACRCEHQCDPLDPHAGATGMRAWDARCEARCSPGNCHCPHPCES